MDAEAVANRSSYWKLAAALQSFLLLLEKKRLGKDLKQLRTSDADLIRFIEADDPVRRFL